MKNNAVANPAVRKDGRDSRADGSYPRPEGAFSMYDRGMADADALHIRDRIERAGGHQPRRESEISKPSTGSQRTPSQ